ncbi:histidine kinase [Emticicia sp. BO119]|uniref:ligand-binding sensor domain-containing protein n=1 Tax=Emticicia sp. BO119 TaxID=2757768 RepID=UPI0015F02845|nr:histidine kinase [Emticicia sp. BO119]MBA4853963.1 histidine kinase [Emticicia sp. BO119]
MDMPFSMNNEKFSINRRRIYIYIFSLFLSLQFSFAQRLPFTFNQVKISDNSLENRIYCMLKDRSGYLWLGTASGLKRYDSELTITLKHKRNDDKSLVSNGVLALCEDNQGRIWVGTGEGICYFDKQKNQFITIKELNKPDYACFNIVCDSRGDIWFTIRDRGLFKFDSRTSKLQNFRHIEGNNKTISSSRIIQNGLIEAPDKKGLWIICNNDYSLNYLDFSSQKIFNRGFNPTNIPIFEIKTPSAITINQNKIVFVNNDTQEIVWYDTQNKKIAKSFKLSSDWSFLFEIENIFFDANQNLWLGSFNNRIAYIDFGKNQTTEIKYEKGNNNSITANRLFDILQEKNGTIWLATLNGVSTINGLSALYPNKKAFDIFDFSNAFFKNDEKNGLMCLVEDSRDSSWWIETSDNRLINYEPETNQSTTIQIPENKKYLNYDIPIALHDYQQKLLVVKPYEIFQFEKKTKQFEKVKMPALILYGVSYSISHTNLMGDSLWVFLMGKKIYKTLNYHLKTKTWKEYPIIFSRGAELKNTDKYVAPNFSLYSKSDEFWIAIHSGGLAKFSKEKQAFEVVKTKQDIDFTKIGYTGFVEDKNGKFWLGSYDLIKFDPKTYDFQTALDMDLIDGVSIDDHDNLCVTSLDNILYYNEKTGEKFTFNFQTNDLFSEWGNRLTVLKNKKIVSTYKQMAVLLNFKRFKLPSFKDQLFFNRVSTADTSIVIYKNNSQVNFNANQNSFYIYFGILTPPNNGNYEMSYQLEGYDKSWVLDKEGKKMAVYGHLDGGDYLFKIRAKDINQNYLPIQTLRIHIDTLFYRTLWFKVLCVFAGILMIISFFRYRTNHRKKIHHLQIQSTRLEKDKTEIQYQNLINHLNPHFLFNSLTSLNGFILSEPDVASDFLQKLSSIYRYILQNKDTETVSLGQELAFVKNYVNLQKSRFEEGLQVNIVIEDKYMLNGIVPVTLQNLFENAIKHNTIEEDKPLVIDVFIQGEQLIVKNNIQKKKFVETSNKQGLDSLKTLYKYLSTAPLETIETETEFIVKVPLLS